MRPDFGLIDSGDWAQKVYDECYKYYGKLWPTKGSGANFGSWNVSEVKSHPGASAPPSTTNMELDSYKVFNGTCLNLILAFVLLVRMFHTGRMEALGLKKHSLKVLLYAPAAGYLLVLAIHFLLDKAGLFQWIKHATNAPAEQSIVSVLRHSSDIPLITVI